MKNIFTFCFFLLFAAKLVAQSTTLISYGSNWKYKDDGSNQGTAWYSGSFNDASWASGNAELGYGDGDETTVVSYGSNASAKFITTYFRKTINVPTASSFIQFTMNLRRDDGIVVYINGTEVYRNNMPTGTINYTTPASSACADDGTAILTQILAANTLTNGTNVIAAEIHQNNGTSSDISFEFELIGQTSLPPASLVKGPYLQIGTPTSMIVRWETNVATDTKVAIGTNSLSLSTSFTNAVVSTSHSVQLTGLTPYTKYYYSIGTTSAVIQNGADNYFLTSPIAGTEGQYRFWVVGDCGNASTNQTNCKNQYLAFTGTTTTDGWLLLGDNAYSSGTNTEYNTKFFNYYQNDIMKKAVLWPSPGNHDYNNGASTATTVPYYSIFSTPTGGQAGGQPSGNPAYYSYDYGNIHFLSLDSYGTVSANKMYDTLGAQTLWIKQDLANTNKRWKIAYWHHPPYTMGSHNSDTEGDLVAVHTRFIRILERLGVDLILCGHSHVYERSKLMNGHYGNEASFNAGTHNLSTQSGLYDGSSNSCPYIKDSVVVKKGVVYIVSGSAGQLGGTQGAYPHNAMHYSNATNGGSLVLDINANRLDSRWVCADGVIRDKFTMFKDVNVVKTFTVSPTATTNISASWPGNYVWSNSAVTRSIAVTVTANTTFWVKDPNNCVADTFKFVVNALPPNPNFNFSGTYCPGSSLTFNDLSTNSPTTWTWTSNPSLGVTINTPNSQNPLFTFANSGTYSITLTSSNGFGPGSPYTKTVQINPNPTVTAISNPTNGAICQGSNVTLSGGGALTYTWTGSVTNAVAFTPTVSSNYTVTGTDANGCKGSTTKSITVNPNPTVTAISNPSTALVCSGSTLALTGNGASTYTWSGSVTNAVAFTPTGSATYTVVGTNTNGCIGSSIISVTVNANPTVTVNSPTICVGNSILLTANGASTYSWSSGPITSTLSVNPSSSTQYTITGTTSGCSNSKTATVTVNPSPTITTISNPTNAIVCLGNNLTLTANGALTYTWSGSVTNAVPFTPTASASYTVSGTNANGCIASSVINTTVTPTPTVVVNSATICSGNFAILNASGATTYSWSSGPTTSSISVNPTSTTVYTVTGTNFACSNIKTTTVTVNNSPTVSVNSATICNGNTTNLIASGASTYSWNTGPTSASISVSPSVTTSYSVSGSNGTCSTTAISNVIVNPLPSISANSSNGTLCLGQTATLTASGANSYSWSTGSTNASIIVGPGSTTSYTVYGTDANNCTSSFVFTQTVENCTNIKTYLNNETVLIYPNPNKGNFNIEINSQGKYEIQIFSVLGQTIMKESLEYGLNKVEVKFKSGIYYYDLIKNNQVIQQGKLVIE